jgi:hypothetical protein
MSSAQARVDAFTAQELAEMAPMLEERMRAQLTSRNIRVSDDLLRSMMAKAMGSKEVQLAFNTYGRFHDMGAHPGWRKGQYVGEGRAEGLKKPKASLFYSRTKMGWFGQLVSNLSNKYIETLYDQAVEELQLSATN